MIAKRHRQNHNFTILYNIVGDCHTADAAYALLLDLREDRQMAVDACKVAELRSKAKRIDALKRLESPDLVVKTNAEADLLELDTAEKACGPLLDAALDEIAFIDKCIKEIQPQRKYAHLSDAEATEACQQEEWCLELIRRAENYLLTSGCIPEDHFNAMRQHPSFGLHILPRVIEIQSLLSTPEGVLQLHKQTAKRTLYLNEAS